MSYHDSNLKSLREKQQKVLRDSYNRQMQELNDSGVTVTHKGHSRTGQFKATFHNPSRRKTKLKKNSGSGSSVRKQFEKIWKPEEFLQKMFSITIFAPFVDSRLTGKWAAQLLGLSIKDEQSIDKVRASAFCMILSLSFRGIMETFIEAYGDGVHNQDPMNKIGIKAALLFDDLVEAERSKATFPAYVDKSYFTMWRQRYEESCLDPDAPSLKFAIMTTCYQQVTFSYDQEPAVVASERGIMRFVEKTYDNYVISLRKLLWQGILQ